MGEPSAKKAKTDDQLPEHLSAFQEEQKRSLINIDDVQTELDNLNEQASEEILKVEQKYNKLRHPFYVRRAEYIKQLPNFWSTALLNHHQISSIINQTEEEVLKHLDNLEIEEFEDIKSGYIIRLAFKPNDWFENEKIEKQISLSGDKPSTATTLIKWKEGKCFVKEEDASNGDESVSFFEWLVRNVDPALDDIAEVIKDDIWPNPLQYFLCPPLDATAGESAYEEFLDDEEQLEEVDDEGGSEDELDDEIEENGDGDH